MGGYQANVRRCPQGFTLVELLLVLALLVMVAALAWPALQRPLANYRLRAAADLIRTEWLLARVEAMRSGQPLAFRFVAGGNRFCREKQSTAFPADLADEGGTPEGTASRGARVVRAREGTLPEGIIFAGDSPPGNARAESTPGSAAVGTEAAWGAGTVLFYPDGTTSDARLVLANERGNTLELILRGLTGMVTVGEVQPPGARSP